MTTNALDDAPLSKFHVRTAIAGSAGPFSDGYILGIVAPALPLFVQGRDVSPLMNGLLGASALVGVFLGASFFGWLADRIGRRWLFLGNMIVVAVLSLTQIWIDSVTALLIIRLVLGLAVGSDYSVSPAIVAEFSPKRQRATLLAIGPSIFFTSGYVASFIVGAIFATSDNPDAWRWMLVSGAIPAVLIVLVRLGIPESPRWLAEHGQSDRALEIVRKHVDAHATLADIVPSRKGGPSRSTTWKRLNEPRYRRRLIFVCTFWFCQVVPYYAVFTFLPSILESLSGGSGQLQTLAVNLFLLIGGVVGVILISRIGRRPFSIVSFLVLLTSTAALGVWVDAPIWYILAAFAFFALVSSAMSAIDVVYPNELFPTDIRGTAAGMAVAVSRVGSAIGTFLLPVGMAHFGVYSVSFMAAGVAAIGLLVCIFMAPETRGMSLSVASGEEEAAEHTIAQAQPEVPAAAPGEAVTENPSTLRG